MPAVGSSQNGGSDALSGASNQATEGVMDELHPLQRLAEREEVSVQIDPKAVLLYTMHYLGAKALPEFTSTVDDDGCYKFCIKLDVSDLQTMNCTPTSVSEVVGGPSVNAVLAERDAVMMAFDLLQKNHSISIVDFSTRLAQRYESYTIHDHVVVGIAAAEKLLSQWQSTLEHCHSFAVKIQGSQFINFVAGEPTAKGKVYAQLGDSLLELISGFLTKASHLSYDLKYVEYRRNDYEKKKTDKAQFTSTNIPWHRVSVPNKDILDYVLVSIGIEKAEYSSTKDPHGMVMTSLTMKFPFMERHQFSGPLTVHGKGQSAVESADNAAFEALVFIENHMRVLVRDFNFSHRKESLKHLEKLIGLISDVVDISTKVRLMWSRLNIAIEFHIENFSLDAPPMFTGDSSEGQIEAYRSCHSCLLDVQKDSLSALASCGPNILALKKLNWKVVDLKSNLGI